MKPKLRRSAANFFRHGFRIIGAAGLLVLFGNCPPVSSPQPAAGSPAIQINQLGYFAKGEKVFAVVDTTADHFVVRDLANTDVYQGPLVPGGAWTAANDAVSLGDFSEFQDPGYYRIHVEGSGDSSIFCVGGDPLRAPLSAALKFYYYQRCSSQLTAACAGTWARAAGHPDTDCIYHTATTGLSGTRACPGGWYDAGDFGKYVVSAGITVGSLLSLYELAADAIGDDIGIPESWNGSSDLLDEVRWEIEWLTTMQDSDGGVFFKIGPLAWPAPLMPADDQSPRYVIGKSTTSTLDFCAVLAQAYRVYEKDDPDWAHALLTRALAAWDWAVANPLVAAPAEIGGTGPYDDPDYSDEFLWAAAELYASTEENEYRIYLDANLGVPVIAGPANWQDVKDLAYYTLAKRPGYRSAELEAEIVRCADSILKKIASNPYRIPLDAPDFVWGSNALDCNFGIILAYAHYLTGDQAYLDGALLAVDYLFGKNPLGMTWLTGFGSVSPLSPCHSQSRADGIAAPVPGMLTGGANQGREDGLPYTTTEPAKCFLDRPESFSSNEPAVCQNAACVLFLGYLRANRALWQ